MGYGGTKEEMQRLLSDAEKLTGEKFDVSNFADITEAIHAIQTEMGITGTTSKEAAGTIEGSVNQMKAAWENWLTALGSGDDLGEVTDQLFESVATAASNIIPRLGEIAGNLGNVIAEKLPEKISEAKTAVEDALLNLVPSDWMGTITSAFDKFDVLGEKVSGFLSYLGEEFASFSDENGSYMGETFNDMLDTASEVFDGIVDAVKTAMPIIKATIQIAMTVIRGAFNGLRGVVSVVRSVFSAVKTAITHPIETAKGIIKGIISTIKGFFNFSVPAPHIPLPHFSISPSGWKLSDLLKGSVPSLGINWYAHGGVFDSPSVIGVGEAGREYALRDYHLDKIADKMSKRAGGSVTINLNYDAGADANQMVMDIAAGLNRINALGVA